MPTYTRHHHQPGPPATILPASKTSISQPSAIHSQQVSRITNNKIIWIGSHNMLCHYLHHTRTRDREQRETKCSSRH